MFCVQVVSDIDDTLMCSGGTWPAGRDTRYPRKCMYPGALALYAELDIGYCTRLQVSMPTLPTLCCYAALCLSCHAVLCLSRHAVLCLSCHAVLCSSPPPLSPSWPGWGSMSSEFHTLHLMLQRPILTLHLAAAPAWHLA